MKLKAGIISLILMLVLPGPPVLLGQKQSENVRQAALDAFSAGDYEQAYMSFSELLVSYPRDPLYKYYAGASLVELRRDPAGASDLLKQAIDAASFKSLPAEALFYLGRAEQMQGNFDEAIRAFNRYSGEAGRKKAREMDVQEYVEQSRNGEGKIQPGISIIASSPSKAKKETLPSQLDRDLGETLEKQFRADSIARAAEAEKKSSAQKSQPAGNEVKKAPDQKQAINKPAQAPVAERETTSQKQSVRDTSMNLKQIFARQTAVFSVFEVLPEPVTDPRSQVAVNPEIPEGLIYRIQLAVFRNPVALSVFKGISPIYGFKPAGANATTYYAGMFRRMADAKKALSSVRAKGFRDSFVAPIFNGKTVSVERSAVLEKEWGNKPLFSLEEDNAPGSDTIPPALVFSVEVSRSSQPLPKETVDTYVKFAGIHGLEIRQLGDGNFVYLIGNFITFESAEEYAGLLKRNGYREARVTAWLGKREIDVETAKQLFENLQ